jgi:hypothetical protein
LQLWLSYDFNHFLILIILVIIIVFVIDNLYDDNLYAPVPVSRRGRVPKDFLWWRGFMPARSKSFIMIGK